MGKEIKELKFEELTLEQKFGMVLVGHYGSEANPETNFENCLELIRRRSLGAMWILPSNPNYRELIRRVKEAADYPILILTDASTGMPGHEIGLHTALGYADDERLAYLFGKVSGVLARKDGYTTICNSILDMTDRNAPTGRTTRVLGCDKVRVAELAAALARGMHDAGMLTVGKHFPSVISDVDTHMAEGTSTLTEEELLDYNLYPYLRLMEEGLLDGVMTAHSRLVNIDPDYPASLSAKVTSILRRQGFDGFMITDALPMMGIVAKFGLSESRGLAIRGGNDLALAFRPINSCHDSIREAYEKGVITPERLDEAVKRVLAAQARSLIPPKTEEISDREWEEYNSINHRSVAAITDPGLPPTLDPEGHHFFVVLTNGDVDLKKSDIFVDTFAGNWYNPIAIAERIRKRFPNSAVTTVNQFPCARENKYVLEENLPYDDVVFVTFCESAAYLGREAFTARFLSLIEALQITSRVAAVIHCGNSFLLEELPHIPRIISTCRSYESILAAVDMLAGIGSPTGKIPYHLHLK